MEASRDPDYYFIPELVEKLWPFIGIGQANIYLAPYGPACCPGRDTGAGLEIEWVSGAL